MTDLERAADLVARSVPIGFSTPEDNDRCCGIIDALAAEILRMDGDPDPEGLAALITRQQDRLEQVSMELSNLRDENFGLKSDLAMERGERLLAEHQAIQSMADAVEAEVAAEEAVNPPVLTAEWKTCVMTLGLGVTPELILTTLMKRPTLMMQVKALVKSAKITGPWESFNTSAHAKSRRTGYGPDASVRFTPEPYTFAGRTTPDRVVALVNQSCKPQKGLDWDGFWDEEQEAQAEYEYQKDMARWEKTPWRWIIESHEGHVKKTGFATSRGGAQIAADKALKGLGWVLVGNSDVPETVQERP